MTDARRWIALAVFLTTRGALAQTASPDAAATPPDAARDAARLHFQRGVELIEQERWADAILELQRARDLRVTPSVLYNLGLAYRAVGRNREAMGAFRAFSRAPGATVDAALTGRVDAYVRELAAGLGWLELQVEPPSARVRVDGAPVAERGPVEVDPGRHVIAVEAEGFASESRTIDVARGAQATVVIRMVPAVVSSRVVVRAEPAAALVRIDGHDVGFGVVEEVVRPGSHSLEVSAAGHTVFRRTFEALAGQTQTIRAVLSSDRTVLSSPWFWVGVVAVAAGAGVAAYFLLQDIEAPYRGTLGTGTVTDALSLGSW